MADRKISGNYSCLFMTVNGILVRIHNQTLKVRQKLKLFARGYRGPTESDEAAFHKFSDLIPGFSGYQETGLMHHLSTKAVLENFRGLEEYYRFLIENEDALRRLSNNLTYMGTHFFRGNVWPKLSEVCREAFDTGKKDKVRIWCAGCSSGKEVYSILMMLLDFLPAHKLELTATDYNDEALAHCREGNYPLRTMDEIPAKYRRYLKIYRSPGPAPVEYAYRYQFRFCGELREMIRTEHHNLLTDEYPAGFDMVLCRNVVKFFTEDARLKVQEKLAQSLNPGGLLVMSESDTERIAFPERMDLAYIGAECIYRKRSASG